MIQVREYALLTCDKNQQSTMDLGVVNNATFDWLIELQERWSGESPILVFKNRSCIKLGSYVGFLQSPNGEQIEILPKTQLKKPNADERIKLRILLRSMLITALKLKPREADAANLQRLNTPLHEWIISEYLAELTKLVRHGLRFDYQQVEEESRFMRGQIDQVKQSRQSPDRATMFHIRHDIFTANRRENRLLKTALNYIVRLTKNPDNWRLANELSHQLAELSPYTHPLAELPKWQNGKLMQSYLEIKPWCEIILEKLNPNFQKGMHKGIALLFPMEYLFEAFVAYWLPDVLASETELKTQSCSHHLLTHLPLNEEKSQNWFQLKPDLLLVTPFGNSVMDTKWKLLDDSKSTTESKYDLKQPDMYQLFAYGKKYMNGKGHMMLIYPQHHNFTNPLPKFSFDENLHLWIVPFDLDSKVLVPGQWQDAFPGIQNQVDNLNLSVN